MKTDPPEPDPSSIEETAAEWFVRRRDGLPPEAEQAYQAWLDADPRHSAALARFQATWDAVDYPAMVNRGKEAGEVLDQWAAARRRRRCWLGATGLAAAAALVLTFLPPGSPPAKAPPVAAVAPRPNIESLPDGSRIELNAQAEIAVQFTPEKRLVRLVRGEAFFSVMKDAARPFVVAAGGVEVRAVGTAFAVRRDAAGVGIVVTEGRIAVEKAAGPDEPAVGAVVPPSEPIYLDAGRRVALVAERTGAAVPAVVSLSAEEVDAALAWRDRRVEFSRMPLADVAALFNARNRVQLSISDRATAAIPISGIFWSDDPEGFARLLESGLGVRTERSADTLFLGSR